MADPIPPPDGRVLVAFDDETLTWSPTWTRLDDVYPNLVTSFTIDRGRQYELDRTDVGRATVEIADPDGVLDPTNTGGPFFSMTPGLEPLLQMMLGRRNPVTGEWHTRFRGFVENYAYVFDPSQRVNRLTIQLVDIFEILAAIEMQPSDPPAFGDQIPATAETGDLIFFDNVDETRDRMAQVLTNARIPSNYVVLFSGNVSLFEGRYSPGENVLTVIAEAADAEFPGVGNVYVDRFGRLVFHGRLARFTPEDLIASEEIPPERWDWHNWHAGDGEAVAASPTTMAHVRRFAFERGLAKIINSAYATPLWSTASPHKAVELTPDELAGQLVTDEDSIGLRGIRSWSAQNLLTERSNLDGANSLVETKRFATYYVDNYAHPRNRISDIGFRSIHPASPSAAANWALLSSVDVSDAINVTIASPGGGGFTDDGYFVEGVHETSRPLGTPDYDDVELSLDLSPRGYYDTNPWP